MCIHVRIEGVFGKFNIISSNTILNDMYITYVRLMILSVQLKE